MDTPSRRNRPPRIVAAMLAGVGLVLIVGAGRLLMPGGSPYYMVAGLAWVLTSALLWRGRRLGSQVYGGMVLVTFARHPAATGVLAVTIAVVAGALLHAATTPRIDPILQTGTTSTIAPRAAFAVDEPAVRGDSLHYGNDQGGARVSPLDQINRTNVDQLQVAWTHRTRPASEDLVSGIEVAPLKVGRLLYLAATDHDVIALDAESGEKVWHFEVSLQKGAPFLGLRGVAYYKLPETSGACAERILINTQDARLIALDAHTGARCQGFGSNGQVSLLTAWPR